MENVRCEKIVLWGSGKQARELIAHQDVFREHFVITDVFDTDQRRWGEQLGGFVVRSPEHFPRADYDKVITATTLYAQEVREQLIHEMQVDADRIENSLFFTRIKLRQKYKDTDDKEIRTILEYLKEHELTAFPYPFAERYAQIDVDIGFDDTAGMFYVWHGDKRMYMARQLDTEEKVSRYYQSIMMEQDALSPHRYLDGDITVHDGDVVVDVGTAEGNFALEVLDHASRLYLIEAEESWAEALQHTFAAYQDKVVIIRAYASDRTEGEEAALDDMIKEEVHFIKMDVEGAEARALAGAERLLQTSKRISCAVCAYHKNEDEKMICDIAKELGARTSVTQGYMFYPVGCGQRYFDPVLRRGIVRLEK